MHIHVVNKQQRMHGTGNNTQHESIANTPSLSHGPDTAASDHGQQLR